MLSHHQNLIVTQARSWLGTAFCHQGRLKQSAHEPGGVDCIGLVIGVIRELELSYNQEQLANYDRTDYSATPDGRSLKAALDIYLIPILPSQIAPGDILLFHFSRNPQHVAFVSDTPHSLGIIHCYASVGKVVEHSLSKNWQNRIVAAYRFKLESFQTL